MKKIIFAFFCAVSMIGLNSCSKDYVFLEPEGFEDEYKEEEHRIDIDKLVKENVSVKVVYGDFDWIISIHTTLKNVLKNQEIKYGIECGYGDYGFYKYWNIDSEDFTVRESIFINADGSGYGAECIYYNQYRYLTDQKNAGVNLTEDEKITLNAITQEMNKALQNGADEYQGRILLEVDNVKYYLCKFSYK